MKPENAALSYFLGAVLLLVAFVLFLISPPAITLYQNNGFFWWGFVPGLIFAAGLIGVILPSASR